MATASEEELRDLCMEWYLLHGEREVRGFLLQEIPLYWHRGEAPLEEYELITDKRRGLAGEFVFCLTPKALELIRGEPSNGL